MPSSSLCSGMPNSSTAGMPSAAISPASSTAAVIDSRSTPGIASIALRPVQAGLDEQRHDEVARVQPGLAHEVAQDGRPAQPAQARLRERHAPQGSRTTVRPAQRSPVLRAGHRVEVVVLPDAVDLQVAQGHALVAEAALLHDAAGADVARHDRRLDAVQAGDVEREPQREPHGGGGVAAAAGVLADPVAERGVLPDAAHDVGQRDAADQPVARARVEDREREARSPCARPRRRAPARAPARRA